MSQENQETTAPAPTPEEIQAQLVRTIIESNTKLEDFQRDKSMFLLRTHLWSGRRVQSDQELIAMGITDIAEYNRTRTKGSKALVPTASLRPLQQIKYNLDKTLIEQVSATRDAGFESIHYVPVEKLEEAIQLVMDADKEIRKCARDYVRDPNGYAKDREEMIQLHMAEVGKDQLTTLVTQRVSTAGPPPEGISAKEWRLKHQRDILAEFGGPQEIAQALGLDYQSFFREYPSEDYVAAAYHISFKIFPMPFDIELSQTAESYKSRKAAEAAERTIQKVQENLKVTLIEALRSFRQIMREKDTSDRINARSIKRVRKVFDRFKSVGDIFGDFTEVNNLIESCKLRFEMADSWTVEEAKALGIEEALGDLLKEAEEMVVDIYRDESDGGEMFLEDGDDIGDMDRGSIDDIESRDLSTN